MIQYKPFSRNHDHAWKQAIKSMPEQFIAFFLPALHAFIDFRESPVFLEKELLNLIPKQDKSGYRISDKLIEFQRKDGRKQGIIVHIEIQATQDEFFDERVYETHYRIYDYFKRRRKRLAKRRDSPLLIEAIAIFVTEEASKCPLQFEMEGLHTYLLYKFGAYHVKDQSEQALLQSNNPFALAVAACLQSNATNPENRLSPKRKLFNLLKERAYSDVEIHALFWFIHLIMILPKEQEKQLLNEYVNDKKNRMKYIMKDVDRDVDSILELIFTADGKKSVQELLWDYKGMEERYEKALIEKERLAKEKQAQLEREQSEAFEKLKQQVIRLHKLGMPIAQIAEVLGEKKGRVGGILDEYEESLQ